MRRDPAARGIPGGDAGAGGSGTADAYGPEASAARAAVGPGGELTPAGERAALLILALGRAAHENGAPAHRLEELMSLVAPRLGLAGQFLSTPTSLTAAFGEPPAQRTFLLRVEPASMNLGKLAELDDLIRDVAEGRAGVEEGLMRVERIRSAPPPYGAGLTLLCFAVASAGAARFFGGGWREMALAGAIGLATGGLAAVAARVPAFGRLYEPIAALAAALTAGAGAALLGQASPYVASIGGLIVLVPGLGLTMALTELATRNLVSGTARLAGVAVTFFGLAGGLALGAAIATRAWGVPANPPPVPLPGWTVWAALAVTPLALTVLFRARARDAGWILAAGVLAFVAARSGTAAFGSELGTFLAAATVAVATNLYARTLDRPAAVPLIPAILLLIPGSVGIRSISSLIERDVVEGVGLAFTLLLVAIALAAGILFANLAVSPRRGL